MSTWAKPGVKCVCVDDNWKEEFMGRPVPSRVPMINEVLTVRQVFSADMWPGLIIPGGLVMSFDELGDEGCWFYAVAHFKPLVTRTQEQDLEQFIPLLSTKPHEVDA